MKKVRGIAMALMLTSMLAASVAPAAAAEAHGPIHADLAVECTVTLSVWPTPSGGAAQCTGSAYGHIHHGGTSVTAVTGGSLTVNVSSYSEGCLLGEPPVTGTATGTATIQTPDGPLTANFTWQRVGLTAAITISNVTFAGHSHSVVGGGTAAFAPLPPIPTCETPGPLTALVAGNVTFAGP